MSFSRFFLRFLETYGDKNRKFATFVISHAKLCKKLCSKTFYKKITFKALCSKFTFCKKSIEGFHFWTFLKCPFSKIDPTLFCKFFIFLSVKLFNNQIVLQNNTILFLFNYYLFENILYYLFYIFFLFFIGLTTQ